MSRSMSKTMVAVLAALLVIQPVFSWAGSGARVIPQGKVSLLEEGKAGSQFQSELPLPEGTFMLCNGDCLVQTQNLQVVGRDQAVFALAERKGHWDLTVKSGQLDFALQPDAKPISFHTPQDTLQTQGAILSASGSAMVRGTLVVTEQESMLTMHEGTLQTVSADGTILVEPGQGLRLAQATTPAAGGAKAASSGGSYAAWTWPAVALGVGGIAAMAAVIATSGGTHKAVSPQ